MNKPSTWYASAAALALSVLHIGLAVGPAQAQPAAASAAPRPALTVTVTQPQPAAWQLRLNAAGSIAAWQEAIIGAEGNGARLVEVLVGVGDRVKRGQLLARLSSDTLAADLAQTRASVREADALLAEAASQAQRGRELRTQGFYSAAQTTQLLTAEATARARLDALRARLQADELRLAQTRVLAPDDGIISARWATVGAMAQPGQELFRLIRRERLEWRAEVPAADLSRLKPGVAASIVTPAGQAVQGTVRMVSPVVDPQTRNGLVYVDLAASTDARAGMYARGEFVFGQAPALTLPQTAVQLRDGFASVMRVGANNRVSQVKVATGRRQGDRIELTSGLSADARVVVDGGAFLADGDLVKVVAEPARAVVPVAVPPAATKATAAPTAPASGGAKP